MDKQRVQALVLLCRHACGAGWPGGNWRDGGAHALQCRRCGAGAARATSAPASERPSCCRSMRTGGGAAQRWQRSCMLPC